MPSQGTNREKYFNRNNLKEKCRLWREIKTFPSISPSTSPLPLSMENIRASFVTKGHQNLYSRTDTLNIIKKKRSKVYPSRKTIIKLFRLNKVKNWIHDYMFKMYICFHFSSFIYIFESELGLFLVRSSIILLCCSFLPGRYGTVLYSFAELFVAALLSEWRWVNTELICSWLERHTIIADSKEFQVTAPDWKRRNTYGTNIHIWSHAL